VTATPSSNAPIASGLCELLIVLIVSAFRLYRRVGALLWAVDEEQPGERPERLAAEVVAVLLLDDQYPGGRP
jgi:hypothetical protein